jgi:hypothetical protein
MGFHPAVNQRLLTAHVELRFINTTTCSRAMWGSALRCPTGSRKYVAVHYETAY